MPQNHENTKSHKKSLNLISSEIVYDGLTFNEGQFQKFSTSRRQITLRAVGKHLSEPWANGKQIPRLLAYVTSACPPTAGEPAFIDKLVGGHANSKNQIQKNTDFALFWSLKF